VNAVSPTVLHGQLPDPFGHRWNIAQRIHDVAPDEIAAAAAEMVGQPTISSGSSDG
jgi:hypothetical protein